MDESLRQTVGDRAGAVCEYSGMPQALEPASFQLDHIIAEQHGGRAVAENLALACVHCNKYKGPNIAGLDTLTGQLTPLFNPRRDYWAGHFEWDGPELHGRTAIGRVTVQVLAINDPDRVALRQLLLDEGLFPPAPPMGDA